MSTTDPVLSATATERLATRWWVMLPGTLSRYSRVAGSGASDGIHWLHWPRFAAAAPVVSLAFGCIAAAIQPGHTFTTSLVSISLVALAAVSGFLCGVTAWGGYVIVDLLTNSVLLRPFSVSFIERWLGAPAGQLIEYLLLAILAGAIPLATLAVRVEIRALGWYRALGEVGERLAALGVWTLLVYFWVRSLPVLIRPPFSYQGSNPPAAAVVPVQERWWVPVLVAAAAMAVRLVLERRATGDRVLSGIRAVGAQLSADGDTRRLPARWVRVAGAAATTLLLGGLITHVVSGLVVFAVLMGAIALRDFIRAQRKLPRLAKIPLIVRYVIGVLLTFVVVNVFLRFASTTTFGRTRFTTDSFVWPLVGSVASIVVLTLLAAPVSGTEADDARTAEATP